MLVSCRRSAARLCFCLWEGEIALTRSIMFSFPLIPKKGLVSGKRCALIIFQATGQNAREGRLKCDRGGSFVWSWMSATRSLFQTLQQVWLSSTSSMFSTRKTDEKPYFHEQIDPPPSPAPPPTSGSVSVGLAVLCLSGLIGLTCSLYMILSTH